MPPLSSKTPLVERKPEQDINDRLEPSHELPVHETAQVNLPISIPILVNQVQSMGLFLRNTEYYNFGRIAA
jgi:hypothetical protein